MMPTKLHRALSLLLEASRCAKQCRDDPWEFAVEIDQLRSAGVSSSVLRLLIRCQHVEHAIEVTSLGDNRRKFHFTQNLCFAQRSCFVLTPVGLVTALGLQKLDQPKVRLQLKRIESNRRPMVPKWDVERRELTFQGRLVKQFRAGACSQEVILAAFHEEGWPSRIDDPLPPISEVEPKRRLSEAIRRLNGHCISALIHFRSDGSGEGVIWELADILSR